MRRGVVFVVVPVRLGSDRSRIVDGSAPMIVHACDILGAIHGFRDRSVPEQGGRSDIEAPADLHD